MRWTAASNANARRGGPAMTDKDPLITAARVREMTKKLALLADEDGDGPMSRSPRRRPVHRLAGLLGQDTTRPSGSTPTCWPAVAGTPSMPPTSWARASSCCGSRPSSPPAPSRSWSLPRLRDDRGRRPRPPRGHGLRARDRPLAAALRPAADPAAARHRRRREALMEILDDVRRSGPATTSSSSSTRSAAPSAARRTTPTRSATSTTTPASSSSAAASPGRGSTTPARTRQGTARQLEQGRRRRPRLGADQDRERRLPEARLLPAWAGCTRSPSACSRTRLRFQRLADDWPAGTGETANLLDRLEVPLEASTRRRRTPR